MGFDCYLLFEQWHLAAEAEAEDILLPTTESARSWHFLRWLDDNGGFLAENAGAGGAASAAPTFPFDTLPSPVIVERNDDEVVEDDTGCERVRQSFSVRANPVGLSGSCLGSASTFKSMTGATTGSIRVEFWGGARRNRAWPVRFSSELTCLKLDTVKSVS